MKVAAQRPAILTAAIFIVGILLARAMPDRPLAFVIAAGLSGLLGIAFLKQAVPSTLSLGLALLLTAISAAQLESLHYPSNHISAFTADERKLARAVFRINDVPRVTDARQTVIATAVRLQTDTGWQPITGRVTLRLSPPISDLAIDQTVECFGWLARPEPTANPGQFDWQDYYREQRILATFNVARSPNNVTIVDAGGGVSLLSRLRQGARDVLAKGFNRDQSLDHALLRALLLGDNDPQLRDVQDLFIQTGTSHHLAVSGMHIAVMGSFVYLLCRLLRQPPRRTAVIVLLFVLLYGLTTLPAAPVVRSVLLCGFILAGSLLRRSIDALQLLALTILGMLIYHPADLYNAGFLLSFGTVLGLILFATPLFHYFKSFEDADVNIARQFQRPRGVLRFYLYSRDILLGAIAAGIVAWAISLPMILTFFDRLNPWAAVSSILLAPVVFAGMIAGLMKVILTLALPWFAPTWASLATWPMHSMRWCVEQLARLPGSDLLVPAPPLWLIVIYYGLLLLYLAPPITIRLRNAFRLAPALCGSLCLSTPALLSLGAASNAPLTITVLSVGAGSCTVVQTPTGRTMLIDAGSSTIPNPARAIVLPFLRERRIRSINSIFISHANTDHFNAAVPVAQRYGFPELFLTPQFALSARRSAAAADLLEVLNAAHHPPRTISTGEKITLDDQTSLEILWPPPDRKLDPNDSSMVLRLTYRNRSILFTGDIQQSAQRNLTLDPNSIHSDILIAPHHGSSEPTTPAFLEAVNPQFIISSNDSTLTQKQRHFDQMVGDRPLYRTNRSGAVTITVSGAGELAVSPFRSH